MSVLLVLTLPDMPSLRQGRSNTLASQLVSASHYARSMALAYQTTTYICPSLDGVNCDNNWQTKQLLVLRTSATGASATLLYVISLPAMPGKLSWRGFGTSSYPMFNPTGDSFQYNGTWQYCSDSPNEIQDNRKVILSSTGKITVKAGERC